MKIISKKEMKMSKKEEDKARYSRLKKIILLFGYKMNQKAKDCLWWNVIATTHSDMNIVRYILKFYWKDCPTEK
jgi:hypothetical protein